MDAVLCHFAGFLTYFEPQRPRTSKVRGFTG